MAKAPQSCCPMATAQPAACGTAIAALRDRYQVVVWDMRGHGQSDYPDDPAAYSEVTTVEDMAAILAACGIQRAVIGGLSLGGYMSLAFHRTHPAMTRALMIFDTGPGFRKAEAREAWNQRARQRADDLDARGLAALGTSDEVRMSQHRDATGLAGAARGMLTQRDNSVFASLETISGQPRVGRQRRHNFLAATDYMARRSGRRQGGGPGCGPCVKPAPAGSLQPCRRGVPGRSAGMNFDFPDELKQLRDKARRFLTERCPTSVTRRILEGPEPYDRPLWQAMAEMGWTGAAIPEEFGGAGLGHLAVCVLAEELGHAVAPVPFASSVYLATEAILRFGSDAQKQQYLPKLARGEIIGTLAMAERPGPADPASLTASLSEGS